uniref:SRCR domain-containing protein n=1 Tax=Mola mola TaxID=94237 RepID=A0A3Q4BEW7_MOLML
MKLVKCILLFQGTIITYCKSCCVSACAPTGDPLIDKLPGKCSFTLRMPGNGSRDVVPLMAPADVLLDQICQDLHCGSIYHVKKRSSPPNAVCFHDCLYQDGRFHNCSQSSRSNCTLIFKATCGGQAVRLAGGWDRCAGRVELWRNGRWGTVCDDRWDLQDAGVVCNQLGCGRALSVTGHGGAFPRGRGPIHLDELNCTGREDNLWACPSSKDKNDCGHKEDAGVVCSEMRAVRLTGGLDRCSGKVEIHRNGSWGKVCDNCWNERLASVVCSMLQCGSEPKRFFRFLPPLVHNDSTLWCFSCPVHTQSLWECREIDDKPHLCQDSRAAGVICNDSSHFKYSQKNYQRVTFFFFFFLCIPAGTTTTSILHSFGLSFVSPELLITIAVSLLLLVILITNTLYCCHYRKKHAYLLKQMSSDLCAPSQHRFNSYQDSVNLTKVMTHLHRTHVPSNPGHLWTEPSIGDGTSVDTDYKQYESSYNPSVPLSTFRNSQEPSTFVNPFMKPSGFENQVEEGAAPKKEVMGTFLNCNYEATRAPFAGVFKISVNSFDTSSTFSGESFEVTEGQSKSRLPSASTSPRKEQTTSTTFVNLCSLGDEDVGPDPSSDDDYDDLGCGQ